MRDEEKILAELHTRATDPNQGQALSDLCGQLVKEFESKASQGVTNSVIEKLNELRANYRTAYSALVQKMGLKPPEGSR